LDIRTTVPRGTHVVSLAVLMALTIALGSAAQGPLVDVTSHEDGCWVTTKEVLVEGTAAPVDRTVLLEGEDLAHGEHAGIDWDGEGLAFSPRRLFWDGFDAQTLDTARWTVLEDPDNVSLEDGALKLSFTYPGTSYPLVRTATPIGMVDADLVAEFRAKFTSYSRCGAGVGLSRGTTDPYDSHMALQADMTSIPNYIKLLVEGSAVHNGTYGDWNYHVYTLSYSCREGTFDVLRDGEVVATRTMAKFPDTFFAGKTGYDDLYPWWPTTYVDYFDMWAMSGEWVSEPVEMGNPVVLDGCQVKFTTTHPNAADLDMEVSSSTDGDTWTEWVPVDGGLLSGSVAGSYLKVRLHTALDDVRSEGARIDVSGVELRYHCPLAGVEARREGGEWTLAQGLGEWSARLDLVEGENAVEVRPNHRGAEHPGGHHTARGPDNHPGRRQVHQRPPGVPLPGGR
jgi:hypothetical protein